MKKKVILFVLAILTGVPAVSAQVMDMRAFSRQRGFKAYQTKPVLKQTVSRQRGDYGENTPPQPRETVSGETEKAPKIEEKDDQTNEIQQYIANNPQVRPDI